MRILLKQKWSPYQLISNSPVSENGKSSDDDDDDDCDEAEAEDEFSVFEDDFNQKVFASPTFKHTFKFSGPPGQAPDLNKYPWGP